MKTMKCNRCGKELKPEVTWHGEVLQVLWYCEEHRCGWVRDIYFTRSDYPSPFADANLKGCPTDEEIQLAQDATDQEEEEYVPLVEFVRGWKEGRGHGNFPEDDEIPYEFL